MAHDVEEPGLPAGLPEPPGDDLLTGSAGDQIAHVDDRDVREVDRHGSILTSSWIPSRKCIQSPTVEHARIERPCAGSRFIRVYDGAKCHPALETTRE